MRSLVAIALVLAASPQHRRFMQKNLSRGSARAVVPQSIDPALGDTLGGALVTISGTGLDSAASITVGGQPCTSVVATATLATCRSPALDAGTYNVVVTGSTTGTLTSAYESWTPSVDIPAARVYQSDHLVTVDAGSAFQFTTTTVAWGITTRDGAGMVATSDGTLVLTGGWNGTPHAEWSNDGGSNQTTNQVYNSTDNGRTWQSVLAHVDDPPQTGAGQRFRKRHSHGSILFNYLGTEYVYVIGGDFYDVAFYGAGTYPSDVWRSADKGATWERVAVGAPWGNRMLHMVWSMGSTLYLAGGQSDISDKTSALNDVWKSTDGGATWTALASAPWSGRGGVIQPPIFGGYAWVIGGQQYQGVSSVYFNGVWKFDGTTWTQVLADGVAPWGARGYHNTVSFAGKLWVIRGVVAGVVANDAWWSTDGATWTQNAWTAGTTPGDATSAAVTSGGSRLVLAGSMGFDGYVGSFNSIISSPVLAWGDEGSGAKTLTQTTYASQPWFTAGFDGGPGFLSFGSLTPTSYLSLAALDAHAAGHVAYAVARTSTSALQNPGAVIGPAQTIIGTGGASAYNEGPGFGGLADAGVLLYANGNTAWASGQVLGGDAGFVDGRMRLLGVRHSAAGGTDVTLWDGVTQLASRASGGYSSTFTGWDTVGTGYLQQSNYSLRGDVAVVVTADVIPANVPSTFWTKLSQWARKWGSISP